MTTGITDIEPKGWEHHPYRAEWRRVIVCADMEQGEEVALDGRVYHCGVWRWSIELQTPVLDATVAVGEAPTLALACARAALAADSILNAMRALVDATEDVA